MGCTYPRRAWLSVLETDSNNVEKKSYVAVCCIRWCRISCAVVDSPSMSCPRLRRQYLASACLHAARTATHLSHQHTSHTTLPHPLPPPPPPRFCPQRSASSLHPPWSSGSQHILKQLVAVEDLADPDCRAALIMHNTDQVVCG